MYRTVAAQHPHSLAAAFTPPIHRPKSWLLLALFLCAAWAHAPIAWSQAAGYNICIEDGGHAKCKDPIQGTPYWRNYTDPFISGGPYPTELSLYDAFLSENYCSQSATSPPWVYTVENESIPGSASFKTTVTHTVIRNCGDPPIPEYDSVREILPLACPANYTARAVASANHALGFCYIPAVQPCQKGQCPQSAGNPIDVAYGNKIQREVDYAGSGQNGLQFTRTYNYMGADIGTGALNGATGQGWTHTYERRLGLFASGAVRAARPDGDDRIFVPVSGGYLEFGTAVDRLMALKDGSGNITGWTFVDADDNSESYDSGGSLQSIAYRGGQIASLTYSTTATPASIAPHAGLLITVADAFGHQLNFTYNAQGLIATMTDSNGAVYAYTNSTGVLTAVSYPDSSIRQYVYNEAANTKNTNQPYALTGIIDENGTRYATFGYNGVGQAISTQHAGGVDQYTLPTIGYSAYYGSGFNYVKDPLGTTRVYTYNAVGGVAKYSAIDTVCPSCSDAAASVGYDANGNVASKKDFNGHLNTFAYDLTRNLETSRTEASGTPRARTITTTWNASFREPASITEPNRTTAFTYDTLGNVLTKTVTDTTVTPNVARIWTYAYDTYGRMLTADGPRTDVTDVTTYAYYTCTTGYQCGQLHTVTNAAGQITAYNTYNAHGQPLTISDPNGVLTTLTYDLRQRLTSRQVGIETTSFSYWPTGLLKQVTLPDASFLLYTYDAAHRLTQINDSLGNKVVYTLDALGNRTAESAYDPTSALHRTHARVFNTLDELYQDLNASGTAAVTTTFGYDANGNQTSIAAPMTRNTANAYDELNRLKQITDPASGITQFGYDANDNLTSVIDPRTLTTSYTYTGIGDLKTQVSPDTGTTTNSYDSGGNLATSTDARGAVSTYTYDALNRVTSVAYKIGSTTDQTIAFTYDAGTNGQGHLTGASDANHSMSFSYDAQGRVIAKGQTIGTVTKSVSYGYTNADLTSLTTPSGQSIAYGYNANHQVTSLTVNGTTTVLNNVTYEPLGPVNGWTWGNGSTTARSYDTDGKISQISSAGVKTFAYDNAFRLTGITDTSTGAANWTYGYDLLDRITSGVGGTTTRGWTYDANGNRQTETGSAASTYTISATNNRISSTTGALARTYAYDAAGNTLSYATVTAAYNDRGRAKTVTNGSVTETLLYNALGQMIQSSGGAAGTVLYAYDELGHLFGEYSSTGTLIEETLWLGDIPVATLRPSGSTVAVYYVHSDQLNTPRAVTRPSDNKQMWSWFSDPFGTTAANSNPGGAGAFAYNLRFPGQLFDGQAGLHQNMARDYDPAVGRYVESDPIGLAAGVNTYAYVGADPIDWLDPDGLDETHVVNTAGGRSTWDGPTNGNWGGKCWSGGRYSCGGHPMGKAPPADSGDMCYMHHDNCYDKCAGNKLCIAACDRTLIKELLALPNDPKKWPTPPRKGTEADSAQYRNGALHWFKE